jgi:HPt (histidine-containing phosphotransfer) domain-containing protein
VRAGTLPDDRTVPLAAALPQLDNARLLDAAVLSELTGGDDAIAGEVMRDFLDAAAHDLQELALARDHVDAAAMTRQAHKIKGASRIVGAVELGEAAAELEAAGPEGDWSVLLPLVTGVETAVEHLRLYAAERFGVPAE